MEVQTAAVKGKPRPGKLALAIGVATFLIALCIQLFIISRYGTNSPLADEWDTTIPLIADFQQGIINLQGLYSQHNEHRQTILKLLFLAIYQFFGETNFIYFMCFSALINAVCLSIWAYQGSKLAYAGPAILLAILLLMSPAQSENMLWGFQIAFYTLSFGTIVSICILSKFDPISWFDIALLSFLCLVPTFGVSAGLFTWYIATVCLFARYYLDKGSLVAIASDPDTRWKLAGFMLLTLLVSGVFLYDYQSPTIHSAVAVKTPADFIWWVTRALAFPIVSDATRYNVAVLALQLLIVAGSCLFYLRKRHLVVYRRRLVFLIGIQLFILVNAAVIGYARGGIPNVAPRYGTIFLWNAALVLLLGDDALRHLRMETWPQKGAVAAIGFTVAATIATHGLFWLDSISQLQQLREMNRKNAAVTISYLQAPAGAKPALDPAMYPKTAFLARLLDDPASVKALPVWMQAEGHRIAAEAGSDEWPAAGYFPTSSLQTHQYGYGSWQGTNEYVGRTVLALPALSSALLAIPVAGYPTKNENHLTLEILTPTSTRIVYDQHDPHEQWHTWYVDVARYRGYSARLIATDADRNSWLAFDTPYGRSLQSRALDSLLAHIDKVFFGLAAFVFVVWRLRRQLDREPTRHV